MLNNSIHHQKATDPDGNNDLASASFAIRTLITIAERRRGIDVARCRLALLHLETAALLGRILRGALSRHKLSDLQFAILVILFSTEPESLPVLVLAEHAAVSRASVTDALNKLESFRFITRTRHDSDRRVIYVRITDAGQETVDAAIDDYFHAAKDAVREVRPGTQRVLLTAYLQLLRGLTSSGELLRAEAPVL